MSMYYLAAQSEFVDTYGKNTWKRFVEGGLPTAILGILTVFAVLAILWGCLEIFRYVFYTLPEQRKKADQDEGDTVTAPELVSKSVSATEETYADDGEIVAAIIAAITAARAEEGVTAPAGFRVVSFKKRK